MPISQNLMHTNYNLVLWFTPNTHKTWIVKATKELIIAKVEKQQTLILELGVKLRQLCVICVCVATVSAIKKKNITYPRKHKIPQAWERERTIWKRHWQQATPFPCINRGWHRYLYYPARHDNKRNKEMKKQTNFTKVLRWKHTNTRRWRLHAGYRERTLTLKSWMDFSRIDGEFPIVLLFLSCLC